jgi:hypothetical protein
MHNPMVHMVKELGQANSQANITHLMGYEEKCMSKYCSAVS